MSKLLIALLLATSVANAQTTGAPKTTFAPKTTLAANSTTTISVYEGGLIGAQSITGNALRMLAVPFTTTADASQTATAGNFLVVSAATANWGIAIYNDSAGPSTLVTNCASFSSSAPASPMGTLSFSGCNLSSSTKYWATFVTASNTEGLWRDNETCQGGAGQSVFQTGTLGSFTSVASWPGTFPAFTAENKCYNIFATVQFTSTALYYVVYGAMTGACQSTSCTFNIPSTGSNQTLVIGLGFRDQTISTVTDSASDTITQRGLGGTGTTQTSIYEVDRVSSGVSTFSITTVGTGEIAVTYAVISGTASSSFDKVQMDTTFKATPFTSGNTPTTTQANEALVGLVTNSGLSSGTFTGTSGWVVIAQGITLSTPVQPTALLFNTANSTGPQNLTGTFSLSGTTNMPGLITLK